MIRKPLFIILAILGIAGCKSNKVQISGTLTNAPENAYIWLAELKTREIKAIDSVRLSNDGKFRFNHELKTPAFYLVKASDSNFLTMLLSPGEKVNIISEFGSLNYPKSVTGSAGTQLMDEYNKTLQKTIVKLSGLSEVYKKNIGNPDLPKLIDSLDAAAQSHLNEINDYTRKYIDNNLHSLVSLIALYQQVAPNVFVLNPSKDYKYYLKVDSVLSKEYPDYEPVSSLHEQVKQLMDGMNANPSEAAASEIGTVAPEIVLPSPAGDTIRLSSTRGSYVLLDFWASWCSPCRKENPNLVAAYNNYHRRGFQIFQVSLDKTREAWEKGIEDDQLGKWIHVSDIQYWNSEAVKLYKITSIPSNYLLDREGKIIAVNLRGEALQEKLAEIFK
jgi:peroxiredoxin